MRINNGDKKGDSPLFEGYEILSAKEYWGRLIIIGEDRSGDNEVVIYVITGRSPSSQARKLKLEPDGIWVKPIEREILKRGNIDLLVYPPILFSRGIAVSNGRQTADIKDCLNQSQNPKDILTSSLRNWEYEPDAPTFTPRISGCVIPGKKAALSIIKRESDKTSIKSCFDVPLMPGKGKMIATYEGENTDPLPPFSREPMDVDIKETSPEEAAKAVYDALEPREGKKDFRVAVACIYSHNLGSDQYEVSIINRYEKMR